MFTRLLRGIETCRETWRPKIQGTFFYHLLQPVSRVLRSLLPDYRRVARDGIFYRDAELAMCSLFPEKILALLMQELRPKSVLDLGCGTGRSLDYFLEHGVDAVGIEGSKLAISHAKNAHRILRWNLRKELELGRQFDLVFSYEVLEHIHPDYVDNLVRSLVNHSDLLVFTAARVGQGGEGHLNEQPSEYWIAQFKKHDYLPDEHMTAEIRATGESFADNALVFRRYRAPGALARR